MMAGKIYLDQQQGKEVHLVTISDRLPTQDTIDDEQLKQKKLNHPFVTVVGLQPEQLHFVHTNNAYHHLGQAVSEMTNLLTEIVPHEIYLQHYSGGHLDHDITHVITVEASRRANSGANLYEYAHGGAHMGPFPGYGAGLTPQELQQYMYTLVPRDNVKSIPVVLNDDVLEAKHQIFEAWDIGLFNMIADYYQPAEIKAFLNGENYRSLPNYDYTQRPFEPNNANPEAAMGYEWKSPPSIIFDDFSNYVRYVQSPRGVDVATWPFSLHASAQPPVIDLAAGTYQLELRLYNRHSDSTPVTLSAAVQTEHGRLSIDSRVSFDPNEIDLAGLARQNVTVSIDTEGLSGLELSQAVLWFTAQWPMDDPEQQTDHLDMPYVVELCQGCTS